MFKLTRFLENLKYGDISKLYNILNVNEDSIDIKAEPTRRVYVYKIEPILLINSKDDKINSIISRYTEFLREMNFDFEILIRNNKFNINDVFTNTKYELNKYNLQYKTLFLDYIKSMEEMFFDKEIFNIEYYLIISINNNFKVNEQKIRLCIEKIASIGCITKKLVSQDLKNILYECINKIKINEGGTNV